MENGTDVKPESSPEKADAQLTPDIDSEVVNPPSQSVPTPEVKPEVKAEEKVVPYDRFKKVNDELTKLKAQPVKETNKTLDVEDYIDISASLEGLDQREKEKLAREHKLSGRPLIEIRKDKDFQLWQSAYRQELEKENALAPSTKQPDSEVPRSFENRLAGASMADKEKILIEAGLYKNPQGPRADRQYIGTQR